MICLAAGLCLTAIHWTAPVVVPVHKVKTIVVWPAISLPARNPKR